MRLYDIEAQYSTRWAGRHRVMFGGGYRWARDRTERSPLVAFIPAERDLRWANVFAQDTFALAEGALRVLRGEEPAQSYAGRAGPP